MTAGALKREADGTFLHVICLRYMFRINSQGNSSHQKDQLEGQLKYKTCHICEDKKNPNATLGKIYKCDENSCEKYLRVMCGHYKGLLRQDHEALKSLQSDDPKKYIFCSYHHSQQQQFRSPVKKSPTTASYAIPLERKPKTELCALPKSSPIDLTDARTPRRHPTPSSAASVSDDEVIDLTLDEEDMANSMDGFLSADDDDSSFSFSSTAMSISTAIGSGTSSLQRQLKTLERKNNKLSEEINVLTTTSNHLTTNNNALTMTNNALTTTNIDLTAKNVALTQKLKRYKQLTIAVKQQEAYAKVCYMNCKKVSTQFMGTKPRRIVPKKLKLSGGHQFTVSQPRSRGQPSPDTAANGVNQLIPVNVELITSGSNNKDSEIGDTLSNEASSHSSGFVSNPSTSASQETSAGTTVACESSLGLASDQTPTKKNKFTVDEGTREDT